LGTSERVHKKIPLEAASENDAGFSDVPYQIIITFQGEVSEGDLGGIASVCSDAGPSDMMCGMQNCSVQGTYVTTRSRWVEGYTIVFSSVSIYSKFPAMHVQRHCLRREPLAVLFSCLRLTNETAEIYRDKGVTEATIHPQKALFDPCLPTFVG